MLMRPEPDDDWVVAANELKSPTPCWDWALLGCRSMCRDSTIIATLTDDPDNAAHRSQVVGRCYGEQVAAAPSGYWLKFVMNSAHTW